MHLNTLYAALLPLALSVHGYKGYLANCTQGSYVYNTTPPNGGATYLEIQGDNCAPYQGPGDPPAFPINCDIAADKCFANNNGTLIYYKNGNFTNSCTNITITTKGLLSATCSKIGGKTQKTSIQTNNFIGYTSQSSINCLLC